MQSRDELVYLMMMEQSNRALFAQTQFFNLEKPKQLLLTITASEFDKSKSALGQALSGTLAQNGLKALPRIADMATATAHSGIYEFLYHYASRIVHFSPPMLIRMGWGNPKTKTFTLSTKHFSRFYHYFSMFYALLLLQKLISTVSKESFFDDHLGRLAKKISGVIARTDRWPELVTLEEMNVNLADTRHLIMVAVRKAISEDPNATEETFREMMELLGKVMSEPPDKKKIPSATE